MTQDIKMKVTAQNQASPVLKKVQSDIAGLDKAAGNAAGGLGTLGKALGAAGIVAFGAQVAAATGELAKMGAQSLALKNSFEAIGGSTAMLEQLRQASRGMISDTDLMLAANKSMLLGVADTADEMSKLLQIAAARGRAMGLDVSTAFGDIVTGLGRMSPLILDNLGITVNLEQANADYAATLGKTAKALTDAERKQALVNAVIASSAGILDNANNAAGNLATDGFAQLDTAWSNFTTALGESLAPALSARAGELAQFVKDAAAALSPESLRGRDLAALRQNLLAQADPENRLRTVYRTPGVVSGAERDNAAQQAQRIGLLLVAIEQANAAQLRGVAGADQWTQQLDRLASRALAFGSISDSTLGQIATILGNISTGTAAAELERRIAGLGAAADTARPAIADTVQTVDELAAAYQQAAAIVGDSDAGGLLAKMLGASGDIDASLEGWKRLEAGLTKIVADLIQSGVAGDELNTILDVLIGEIGATIDGGADMGDSISQGLLAGIPAAQALIGVLRSVFGWTSSVGGALKGMQREKTLAEKAAETLRKYAPKNGAGDAIGGLGGALGLELSRRQAGIGGRGIDSDLIPLPSIGGGNIGGAVENQLDNLTGRIQSVLQGALRSGIDVSALLPREDAIEEPARRLADIATRGFDSPWTDYIRNTFPEIFAQLESSGDAKGAAAQILRDFEAGLRPELLDKGKAKELVERSLLGDANMSALASEIAAELSAEMGISLADAQAATSSVLGTGASTESGSALASGIVGGVKAANVGAQAAAIVAADVVIKDNLTAVYNAGQTMGGSLASGMVTSFQTNATGALVSVLAALVMPAVLAGMATAGTRTNAATSTGSV